MSPLEVIVYGIAFGTAAFLTESVLDYAVSLPGKRSRSRGAKKAPTPIRFDVDAFVADLQERLAGFERVNGLKQSSNKGADEGVEVSGVLKVCCCPADGVYECLADGQSVNIEALLQRIKSTIDRVNAVGERIESLNEAIEVERLRRGHVSSLVEDGTERVAQ